MLLVTQSSSEAVLFIMSLWVRIIYCKSGPILISYITYGVTRIWLPPLPKKQQKTPGCKRSTTNPVQVSFRWGFTSKQHLRPYQYWRRLWLYIAVTFGFIGTMNRYPNSATITDTEPVSAFFSGSSNVEFEAKHWFAKFDSAGDWSQYFPRNEPSRPVTVLLHTLVVGKVSCELGVKYLFSGRVHWNLVKRPGICV